MKPSMFNLYNYFLFDRHLPLFIMPKKCTFIASNLNLVWGILLFHNLCFWPSILAAERTFIARPVQKMSGESAPPEVRTATYRVIRLGGETHPMIYCLRAAGHFGPIFPTRWPPAVAGKHFIRIYQFNSDDILLASLKKIQVPVLQKWDLAVCSKKSNYLLMHDLFRMPRWTRRRCSTLARTTHIGLQNSIGSKNYVCIWTRTL